MSNQTVSSIQERFKSFCFFFEKRKSSRQKNQILLRLCEMFKQLEYPVQVLSSNSKIMMSKNLFAGDVDKAETIIVVPYDVGEKMLVKDYIYYPFKMSECRKKEMLNIQFHLLLSAFLTVLGVLIILFGQQKEGAFKISICVIGILIMIFSFLSQGRQSRYNLSKTSSLFVMLEIARDLHSDKIAFCMCDEGGYAKSGLDTLNQMINNLDKKEVIYLDCLASGKEIIIGSNFKLTNDIKEKYDKPIRMYPITEHDDCAVRYFNKTIQIVAANQNKGVAEVRNIANKKDCEAEIKNMKTVHDWVVNYITNKEE